MAYNLESLVRILEQILHPGHEQRLILDREKKPQLESLLETSSSLKQFLQDSSPTIGKRVECLEGQIRDAAHKAEDIIESHIVDQMLSNPGDECFIISPPDLRQVIEELDCSMDRVKKIIDGNNQMANISLPGASSKPDPSSSSIVVGVDEDLLQLKGRLTGQQTKLEMVPIVGMGGIGKTTLARNLYNDELIVSHFDIRAWVTISQHYNVQAILSVLLGCKSSDELPQDDNNQLALSLYQRLYGRRYLIVLDDMWSTNAWDDIKMFFPNENNRSRIILTTRELDVANYVDSTSQQHEMHLLNDMDSWNLLCQEVFGEEDFPTALENIGKDIASSCRGLPLAIHVIGGLLSKAERTEEFWENVANDIRSAIAENDDQFSNILSYSYNNLPNHLKPCFLYMGAFPEDYEIRISRLIRILVAEGFLKSNGDKSLEEVAEDYLKALVARNLISIKHQKSNGKPKSCAIHDLLRDLCVTKANDDKFLCVKSWNVRNVPQGSLYNMRRVSVHSSFHIGDFFASLEFMFLARSFLCLGSALLEIMSPVYFSLRLLRVLDILILKMDEFPTEVLQLVNLRYLALSCEPDHLTSEIARLHKLQTLIFYCSYFYIELPSEIWEMSELRHVNLKGTLAYLGFECTQDFVLENLQTMDSIVVTENLIEWGFLERIPNTKKLGIECFSFDGTLDLFHLHKLETLKCSSKIWSPEASSFLSTLRFPPSIKKLIFNLCTITWAFMTTIGSLPNLQVLKLRNCNFEEYEPEWEATEGEFDSLEFLLLDSVNLVRWRADHTHFPRLRCLIVRECRTLEEIPSGIGDILTLEMIEVDGCRPSVVTSAKQIQEEQRDYGNYGLQVRIV